MTRGSWIPDDDPTDVDDACVDIVAPEDKVTAPAGKVTVPEFDGTTDIILGVTKLDDDNDIDDAAAAAAVGVVVVVVVVVTVTSGMSIIAPNGSVMKEVFSNRKELLAGSSGWISIEKGVLALQGSKMVSGQ